VQESDYRCIPRCEIEIPASNIDIRKDSKRVLQRQDGSPTSRMTPYRRRGGAPDNQVRDALAAELSKSILGSPAGRCREPKPSRRLKRHVKAALLGLCSQGGFDARSQILSSSPTTFSSAAMSHQARPSLVLAPSVNTTTYVFPNIPSTNSHTDASVCRQAW